MTNKKVIPIFYACDDNFVKYTIVSLRSLIDNANKNRQYEVYVLNSNISDCMKEETYKLKTKNVNVTFVDVKDQLERIGKRLPLRDYYSKTTYFRMFIAEMFPEYDKAVYIDSDTVVTGDVSELFDTELGVNYVGACHEQVMCQTEVFGNYTEKVMGINRYNYFNAGVLLINTKKFRENNVFEKFLKLLNEYDFVVTQDQDYLNVICHNKVLWLDQGWNLEVYGKLPVKENCAKIIHYIMVSKPWHYHDCKMKEYFWKYAEKTSVCALILDELNSYTDEKRTKDMLSCTRLSETARKESEKDDRYINRIYRRWLNVSTARFR